MTKRILVIEDQDDLRGILRDLFTRSGYVVAEATDGAAGVDQRQVRPPRHHPDGYPDAHHRRL